jgi:HD-like signal output (HDOD) protein
VIIRINFGDDYQHLLDLVENKNIMMREAEMDSLGIDHAEVGAWLAKSWHLPEKLIEPINCHHKVTEAGLHQVKASVVHLADVLIKASGFGFSGDEFVPRIDPVAWEMLGMDDSTLAEIVEELEDKLVDTRNFSLEIQTFDEE